MPLRELTDLPTLKDIEKIASSMPTQVEIVGTTFGNELQNRILSNIRVLNFLMFYLCTLATLRWFMLGN